MAVEKVWLKHAGVNGVGGTGNVAEFPTAAVAHWKERGWVPCDPPPPVDVYRDPADDTTADTDQSDGLTGVAFVPAIANLTAPTAAEVNAGLRLDAGPETPPADAGTAARTAAKKSKPAGTTSNTEES